MSCIVIACVLCSLGSQVRAIRKCVSVGLKRVIFHQYNDLLLQAQYGYCSQYIQGSACVYAHYIYNTCMYVGTVCNYVCTNMNLCNQNLVCTHA